MQVNDLDYFAFSYIKMDIDGICSYLKSPLNMISGQLTMKNANVIDILKVKTSNSIVSLQEHRTKTDIACIYQYNKFGCIFISNINDGWASLVHMISVNNKSESYFFILDKEKKYINNINLFSFENGSEERIVRTMVDGGKWVFYDNGPLQWFESPEYYERKIIRKRMNYLIVWEYCKKIGIDLENDLFFYPQTKVAVFERKKRRSY